MKIRLRFLLAALILINLLSYSSDNFNFEIDYSTFKYEQDVLLEVYYAFSLSGLTFNKTESGYEAAGYLSLQIIDSATSKTVFDREFKIPSVMNDTAGAVINQKLLGQMNLVIKPSLYIFKVIAKDFNNQSNVKTLEQAVELKPLVSAGLSSSSIQLANKIEKSSNESSVFFKNGLEVTPNPSRLFGNNIPSLFYYFELYNLENSFPGKQYQIKIDISDDKDIVKNYSMDYSVKSDSKVEYGSIDISNLSSGRYNFTMEVSSNSSNENLKMTNNFWIYNIDSTSNGTNFISILENSEYKNMDSSAVEDEIDHIRYLISDRNYEKVKKIKSIDEKKIYLVKFWESMDPTPVTDKNEFKMEYFERVRYANENLKNNYQEGWKSDRGRVLCIYGKPDEVERFDFTGDTRPYEIWHYNSIQGGVVFAFVDISNVGSNYILVHSTAKGELSDSDWRRRLDPRK